MYDQFTAECMPHGSGQCDGYHYEGAHNGWPCGCPCHETDDLPLTTAEVKVWHDRMHGLIEDEDVKNLPPEGWTDPDSFTGRAHFVKHGPQVFGHDRAPKFDGWRCVFVAKHGSDYTRWSYERTE